MQTLHICQWFESVLSKTNHELTGLILTLGMTKPRSPGWLLEGYRVLQGCEVFNSGAAGTALAFWGRTDTTRTVSWLRLARECQGWIWAELSSELQAPKYLH